MTHVPQSKQTHLAQSVRPGRVALEVQGGAGSQHVADLDLLGLDGVEHG